MRAPIPQDQYPWRRMLHQDSHWMDRYGRKIRITRMSDRYLSNALRHAQRACWGQAAVLAGWASRVQLGDMAADALDREMDAYMEYRVPLIEAMVYEQERRKLRPKVVEAVLDRFRR